MQENTPQEETPYSIPATGKGGNHSDIALTSLFNAHVSVINAGRELFWRRFNTMLIANSIVFGFLFGRAGIAGASRLTDVEMWFGTGFGLLLCVVWWILSSMAWKLVEEWGEKAARFSWEGFAKDANPFGEVMTWAASRKGKFFVRITFFIIPMFALAYLFILVDYYNLFDFFKENAATAANCGGVR